MTYPECEFVLRRPLCFLPNPDCRPSLWCRTTPLSGREPRSVSCQNALRPDEQQHQCSSSKTIRTLQLLCSESPPSDQHPLQNWLPRTNTFTHFAPRYCAKIRYSSSQRRGQSRAQNALPPISLSFGGATSSSRSSFRPLPLAMFVKRTV